MRLQPILVVIYCCLLFAPGCRDDSEPRKERDTRAELSRLITHAAIAIDRMPQDVSYSSIGELLDFLLSIGEISPQSQDTYSNDEWDRPYQVLVDDGILRVWSAGRDGIDNRGTLDDILVFVNLR